MKGIVKWFNNQKGFGFITPNIITPDSGADVFVHHTAIKMEGYKTLAEKQEVDFDLEQTEKGPRAVNVRPLAVAA